MRRRKVLAGLLLITISKTRSRRLICRERARERGLEAVELNSLHKVSRATKIISALWELFESKLECVIYACFNASLAQLKLLLIHTNLAERSYTFESATTFRFAPLMSCEDGLIPSSTVSPRKTINNELRVRTEIIYSAHVLRCGVEA